MDREMIDLYCEYEELIDKDLKGVPLQELFGLRHEILTLRKIILKRLDVICAKE